MTSPSEEGPCPICGATGACRQAPGGSLPPESHRPRLIEEGDAERRETLRRAISDAQRASLGCSTHKCASTMPQTPTVEQKAHLDRRAAIADREVKKGLVGPLPEGVARKGVRVNHWKGTKKRRAKPLDGAAAWPIEWYLRDGYVLGDVAMASERWRRELKRISLCGSQSNPRWAAMKRRDGKIACGPKQCHSKGHKNCRPFNGSTGMRSECMERINSLDPTTLLTLTDRNAAVTPKWRDLRHLSAGKRLARFFNLWGKAWGRPAYVWAKECHKSGCPHFHIVIKGGWRTAQVSFEVDEEKDQLTLLAPKVELKQVEEWWKIVGGGWSVRWEHIRTNAYYIAKYIDTNHNADERTRALIFHNKLRDWGSSKGIKRPASTLPVWHIEEGSKEECQEKAREWEEALRGHEMSVAANSQDGYKGLNISKLWRCDFGRKHTKDTDTPVARRRPLHLLVVRRMRACLRRVDGVTRRRLNRKVLVQKSMRLEGRLLYQMVQEVADGLARKNRCQKTEKR